MKTAGTELEIDINHFSFLRRDTSEIAKLLLKSRRRDISKSATNRLLEKRQTKNFLAQSIS